MSDLKQFHETLLEALTHLIRHDRKRVVFKLQPILDPMYEEHQRLRKALDGLMRTVAVSDWDFTDEIREAQVEAYAALAKVRGESPGPHGPEGS